MRKRYQTVHKRGQETPYKFEKTKESFKDDPNRYDRDEPLKIDFSSPDMPPVLKKTIVRLIANRHEKKNISLVSVMIRIAIILLFLSYVINGPWWR